MLPNVFALIILNEFFVINPVKDTNISKIEKFLSFFTGTNFIISLANITNNIKIRQYKNEIPNLYNGNLKNQIKLQNIKKAKINL